MVGSLAFARAVSGRARLTAPVRSVRTSRRLIHRPPSTRMPEYQMADPNAQAIAATQKWRGEPVRCGSNSATAAGSRGGSAASGHPPISDTAAEAARMGCHMQIAYDAAEPSAQLGSPSIRCNCSAPADRDHELAVVRRPNADVFGADTRKHVLSEFH